MTKKKQKNIKRIVNKLEELKKLKSLYKKGLLKFGSKEIAEAMLEDLGTGITGKRIKNKD